MAIRRKLKPGRKSSLTRRLESEPKTSRLIRLADARVPKAVNAIRLVGNLSFYSPTPDQAEVLIKTLTDALSVAAVRLRGKHNVIEFHLPVAEEKKAA